MHAIHVKRGRIVVAAPDRDGRRDQGSIAISTGIKLRADGVGQLNSTPPEIHGPARPTSSLNDVLPIEEVIAGALIEADIDAATDGRKIMRRRNSLSMWTASQEYRCGVSSM